MSTACSGAASSNHTLSLGRWGSSRTIQKHAWVSGCEDTRKYRYLVNEDCHALTHLLCARHLRSCRSLPLLASGDMGDSDSSLWSNRQKLPLSEHCVLARARCGCGGVHREARGAHQALNSISLGGKEARAGNLGREPVRAF